MKPRTKLKDQVADDDRRWFLQHPHARQRLRPLIPGEFWPAEATDETWTLVTQVRPGIRWREALSRPPANM